MFTRTDLRPALATAMAVALTGGLLTRTAVASAGRYAVDSGDLHGEGAVRIRRLGTDALNTTAARLGLSNTTVESDLMTMLDSIGQDLGRAGWKDLTSWSAGASAEDWAQAGELLPTARALDPGKGTTTTPRDMVTLLRLIWTGQAGPAVACERVRSIMAQQLTRHRISSAFQPPVRVAAKSGGLLGVVRNEIGVVSYPDGREYAAAVFTRSRPGSDERAINAAIGTTTARAIASLRHGAA